MAAAGGAGGAPRPNALDIEERFLERFKEYALKCPLGYADHNALADCHADGDFVKSFDTETDVQGSYQGTYKFTHTMTLRVGRWFVHATIVEDCDFGSCECCDFIMGMDKEGFEEYRTEVVDELKFDTFEIVGNTLDTLTAHWAAGRECKRADIPAPSAGGNTVARLWENMPRGAFAECIMMIGN
jgi:hypothetical protein